LKVQKIILLLLLLLAYTPLLAQVDTAWVKRFDGTASNNDEGYDLAIDKSGNVFVTGYSISAGTAEDITTIKYNSKGDTLWVRKYNGPGNGMDVALALALDDSGNVYVTGYSMGSGTNFCYTTIKYDSLGDTLWVRHYNGPANAGDRAYAIAVDDSGNVYITGFSVGSGTTDYLTLKYSPAGDTLWTRRYDGPGNSYDYPYAIAVDSSRNVFVTGLSLGTGSPTSHDYATLKYNSNGDLAWVRRYDGPGNFLDDAYDLAVDNNGNVYVTGFSVGLGTAVDDYATIKYDLNGTELWVRRYNGPVSGGDESFAIAVDTMGNVYVTGYSDADTGAKVNLDYLTIKYSAIGDTLWTRRYNGPGNGNDEAYAIAVDDSGNIYVTGYSDREISAALNQDYATVKYGADGTLKWVARYNGPGNSGDVAYSLAVDDSGNVYVTGRSWGGASDYDFTTIKYIPIACSAKPGDANNDNEVLLSDVVTTINFLFRFQPLPPPACRADANADGKILLSDVVYLINFIYKAGPLPVKNRECCL